MKDFNSVSVCGRLTKDSELKYTNGGTAHIAATVAVNTSRKNGDKWEDKANFFDFDLWGKTAENLYQYLTKGSQVIINGYLEQDTWEKDGQKHSKVKIAVSDIFLVGGKKSDSQPQRQQQPKPPAYNPNQPTDGFDDDLPF